MAGQNRHFPNYMMSRGAQWEKSGSDGAKWTKPEQGRT